jgi:hypothetical protein
LWPDGEISTDVNRGQNCDDGMLFPGFDRRAHGMRMRAKFPGMFAIKTP